jgi:DNA-binding response OmpR family regulator
MVEGPRVLVVDDEAGIVDLLQAVLSEAGFEVSTAFTGDRALKLLEVDADRIRALVTDVRLPGVLDGWELGRRARALAPQLCVIYVTGDSEASWASSGVPGSLLVAKPFAPAQVVTAIASLLNAGGAAV